MEAAVVDDAVVVVQVKWWQQGSGSTSNYS
jgi:hypothetical protein